MNMITATNARSGWFDLLKKTVKGHNPVYITSKEGNAVLLSGTDYESLIETLELLSEKGFLDSVRQAKREIKNGKTYSMDEVFNDN
ncbi:MAG: type II toxin-antitoxin system Phd/YefM family antitoxin [Candidatus Omnitrophica bacterium]|nr:type II toxin-antitoxin system Phd/YefM family antitoxin [Candidatus Omnitrophota bacterium]